MAGNAYGEDEVYYCAEIGRNGFNYEEKSNSYEPTLLKKEHFKIKLDKVSNSIEIATEDEQRDTFSCTSPHGLANSSIFSCVKGMKNFNFSTH